MATLRILLVDDNEAVRRGIRSVLFGHHGLSVCGEASDGLEAIEKTKSLRPDVVLMDIAMPRMDGLQATRMIRRENLDIRIIIVSQNDPAVVRRQAADVHADAYVGKLDLSRDLIPTLERIFGDFRTIPAAHEKIETASEGPTWLAGSSEMASAMRATDWSQTPLGPSQLWSPALRMMVKFLLANRFPQLLWWGPQFCCLYNDAYIPILGAKHPWAIGRPVQEVWGEIWDVLRPLIETPYRGGAATWMEALPLEINRSGFTEETHFTVAYSPVPDETTNSGIGGVLATVHEITEKVVSERRVAALRDLGARFAELKSAEDACIVGAEVLGRYAKDVPFVAFYLFDTKRENARLAGSAGVDQGNPGFEATIPVTGANLDEHWPLGKVLETERTEVVENLEDSLSRVPQGPWADPPRMAAVLPLRSAIPHVLAGFMIVGISSRLRFDDNYKNFLETAATQVSSSIVTARAYEEEKKRAEALAEIDRAKTAFFSNVSHEFRTPLTLMLGPLEELIERNQSDLSPATKGQLEVISRNGGRLLRLVNTLLDFSRIEAGRMRAQYQPTDLAAFTVELASTFRSAIERAGLALKIDCDPLDQLVYVDRDMWEKIVLNLLSNAFKFTFDGEIALSLKRSGDSAELKVRDSGVGIPSEEMPRIFERFHRIESSRSRTHEGSGIGLALVQELVKLHGGGLRAESTLGKGTTFFIDIPLGKAHLPADRITTGAPFASVAMGATPFVEEALRWLPDLDKQDGEMSAALATRRSVSPAPSAKPRIVIADDNADMRQYLTRLLSERFEVEAVSNGELALAAARRSPPALVLSDVMMPRLDGLGLLKELRSDSKLRDISIILLSARAGEESRLEGVAAGADDYLVKPFSARELTARVEAHAKMHRMRQEAKTKQQQLTAEYETLLNQAPLGIYVIDSTFRIRQINPVAMPVFKNVSNPVGRDFSEVLRILWPQEFVEEIVGIFRHTLQTGESYSSSEHSQRRFDTGETEYYEWRTDRIPLPDGTYGVVCYFQDISQKVAARQAIADSERRLRLATAAAELGVWTWYPDEDRGSWENDRVYEIFGRTREDGPFGSAEFASTVIDPEDLDGYNRAITRALSPGGRYYYQGRIYRKDGEMRWVEFTGQMEPVTPGSPRRMLGTVRDITDVKESEEALRVHSERYDLTARSHQLGFWFCDLPFGKLDWDSHVKEHFWLPPDAEVTIDTFYERLHPEDREKTRRAIEASIANNSPYDVEFRTLPPEGKGDKWIRAMGRTFYDQNGRPIRFDGLTIDITDRKRSEERERTLAEEAKAATAKFRAVFEQTTVFAGIMSNDGILIDANRLCLDGCGYRPEDVLGRHYWNTPWWRNSEEVQQKIRTATKMAAIGVPYREILSYSWADGSERIVDFALYPIRDHDERVIFLHPTGVDITEAKRAEDAFRKLTETLEAEVEARTCELEARNEEVLAQSGLLREFSQRLLQTQDEERRHIARELHDSAGQTLTLLGIQIARVSARLKDKFPDLSKDMEELQQVALQLNQEIRTTSYLLHPPMLDETGVAGALQWYVEGFNTRSGIEMQLEIDPDFPRFPAEVELAMFRIVQEALTNIHRHSGAKGGSIRIVQFGSEMRLEVHDHGRGISAEKLAEIRSGGAGVGMRGMRERVNQLHGQLKVESDALGTKISVAFPAPRTYSSASDDADGHLHAAVN
jgi:PAS domain S-box-containing protein